jgi:hypothetical protein
MIGLENNLCGLSVVGTKELSLDTARLALLACAKKLD